MKHCPRSHRNTYNAIGNNDSLNRSTLESGGERDNHDDSTTPSEYEEELTTPIGSEIIDTSDVPTTIAVEETPTRKLDVVDHSTIELSTPSKRNDIPRSTTSSTISSLTPIARIMLLIATLLLLYGSLR